MRPYPGPGLTEWAVLVVSTAFVVIGVLAFADGRDEAVAIVAFFGTCAAVAAGTIVRKRRYARLHLISVEIVGGTPIRPTRSRVALLGATFLGLGLVLFAYSPSAPFVVKLCIFVMIAAGALLLLALLTGLLPVGFLQFDPHGLTIGERRHVLTLPWDSIAAVAPGEVHDNPVLLLWVRDLDTILVRPPAARPRVTAGLRSSLSWFGAHLMIHTWQYGIELPFLVKAIERYAGDPSAREGLAVARLLGKGG